MPEEYRNIYKTARKAAGLTQEAAAERLAVSVESVRAYETGGRIPANDVVARMAVTYNNLMLGYDHCRSTDDLMASIVPPLEQRSIMEVVVRLFNRMKRLDQKGSGKMKVQIHYLPAIQYEEFADKKPAEVAALVKERIQAKIDECLARNE